MYAKMDNLDIYNNSRVILEKNAPKSIVSWITILCILLILLIIFFSIPFNVYKSYGGYISVYNHNSYLNLFITKGDFPIHKNSKLYIKNDKYNYEVIEIEDDKVILKVNLKDEINIDNNVVLVNILSNRTTVFEILKNKIKKGLDI